MCPGNGFAAGVMREASYAGLKAHIPHGAMKSADSYAQCKVVQERRCLQDATFPRNTYNMIRHMHLCDKSVNATPFTLQ